MVEGNDLSGYVTVMPTVYHAVDRRNVSYLTLARNFGSLIDRSVNSAHCRRARRASAGQGF
jgi:hypothetical protein